MGTWSYQSLVSVRGRGSLSWFSGGPAEVRNTRFFCSASRMEGHGVVMSSKPGGRSIGDSKNGQH